MRSCQLRLIVVAALLVPGAAGAAEVRAASQRAAEVCSGLEAGPFSCEVQLAPPGNLYILTAASGVATQATADTVLELARLDASKGGSSNTLAYAVKVARGDAIDSIPLADVESCRESNTRRAELEECVIRHLIPEGRK